MTCTYCGEPIDPEEPDIRYRPGDGEHRLDFHPDCFQDLKLDVLFELSAQSEPGEKLEDEWLWEWYEENEHRLPVGEDGLDRQGSLIPDT